MRLDVARGPARDSSWIIVTKRARASQFEEKSSGCFQPSGALVESAVPFPVLRIVPL